MKKKQRKITSKTKKRNWSLGKPVNRKYKDTLFRMIFRDRHNLLSLYNALNHSSYTNEEDLEITTLEDVIYVGMKNDVSFLFSSTLNLYEHQSTLNPNMPIRGLFYMARIYQNYIKKHGLNLYSTRRIPLPVPVYVVFYNGQKEESEYRELNLSDSFMKSAFAGQAALECRALMLNINLGHNQELLESCKVLWEYSYFINEVRENQRQGLAIETAVQEAQKSCIEKDILKEFLEQNSAEVSDVILEEFDQEKYEEDLRRESWEDGKIAGMEEGKSIGREEGKALEKKELLVNLYRKHLLTLEQAAEEYGTTTEEFQKFLL